MQKNSDLKFLFVSYLALAFHFGCSSTNTDGDIEDISAAGGESTTIESCALKKCDTSTSPSLCFATAHKGQVLLGPNVVQGWGANPCLARNALMDIVCNQKLQLEDISRIRCVPDPSSGECPIAPDPCETGTKDPLVHCRAEDYAGQKLKPETFVYGVGHGSCAAKKNLHRAACRMHLRPSSLGQIVCTTDQTNGDCPPSTTACEEGYRPHSCSSKIANTALGKIALSSFGSNECLARYYLENQACSLNSSPKNFKQIKCKLEE